jgi:signal transduction histidine kinase
MRVLAGRWVSIIVVPVPNHRGVLALVQLPEIVGAEALPRQSVATILDGNGTILARSSAPQAWSGRDVRDSMLVRMALLHGEGTTEARGVDGVEREYGFTYLPRVGWHVYVGIPTAAIMQPVRRLLLRGLLGGAAIVALVIAAAMLLARRIQKPIDALARAAAASTRGASVTVAPQGPREIAVMAEAFNEMIESRARSQARISESERNLKKLSERILLVEEEERRRIAREIHDDLGQSLTALKMDVLGLLEKSSLSISAAPLRERIVRTLDATVNSVQRIAAELRPTLLDDLGLAAAVEAEARLFEERTGIECELSIPSEEELSVEPARATALYRIVQEALTNVFRHSGATRVELRVRSRGDELLLEIRDDGRGMTNDEILNPSSLGLIGIRERAALVGGTVHFEGIAGRGSIVSVRIPPTPNRTSA